MNTLQNKIKLSAKQKEVIKLMRNDESLRVQYETGLSDCVVFGNKRNLGKYPLSVATVRKLFFDYNLLEKDGTERRLSQYNLRLSTLGKTIQL